ncbi:MAG TPA: polymer-forming cytoskeletal protein [Acidobacteriota bacterium]|nr:polymer-forming cytoskeletal protein [Acidobacteriota bacterium]
MQFFKKKTSDEIISLLGKGAELTGEISFTNGLRVEGCIKGKVRSEATLEIGAGGLVDAEVHIRKITINGEFKGIIRASDRVEIRKNGKVIGNIYSPCLIIEAGATFDGHCNMSEEKLISGKDGGALPKTSGPDIGKLL